MQTVELADLGELELLGEGGQGKVYRAAASTLLYKGYFSPAKVRVEGFASLRAARDMMGTTDRELIDAATAFPQYRVDDCGRFAGFLMVEVPEPFWGPIGNSQRRLREIQYLMYPLRPLWSRLDLPTPEGRLAIARAFARLFDVLHRHGIVVGDVSMRNLLWANSGIERAFLIDCDSMRAAGNEPAVAPAVTPDWDDPSSPGKADLDTDRYKLALAILRILVVKPEARPEQVTSGAIALPDEFARVRDLMGAVDSDVGGARPHATRWIEALEGRGRITLRRLTAPTQRTTTFDAVVRPVILPRAVAN
jgi:hypothetical protein